MTLDALFSTDLILRVSGGSANQLKYWVKIGLVSPFRDGKKYFYTFLVYPGATHRRFEHSLGVMELASRVYDIITNPETLTDEIRKLFPQTQNEDEQRYWRRIIRLAALCHDIGHLPFSHAGEDLMPEGWDHEEMTRALILSPEMNAIWSDMRPKPEPEDIIKLALGPNKASDLKFSDWESLLADIIVGNAFGVDRMDYLLRDSLHTGVAYGRFDHFRLIDTMRILPPPEHGGEQERSSEPYIGVEAGGLQSAEALLLARYFMFSQVYFHPVRRIYDIHLKDFLKAWLEGGCYPTDTEQFFFFGLHLSTMFKRKPSSFNLLMMVRTVGNSSCLTGSWRTERGRLSKTVLVIIGPNFILLQTIREKRVMLPRRA